MSKKGRKLTESDRIYAEIAAELRKRRQQQKLSQAKLAKAVGIARTSLVNFENGRQRVPVQTLALIAKTLGFALKLRLAKRRA